MRCLMCGRDDTDETTEARADRLRMCRRCRAADEVGLERTADELAGHGQAPKGAS